MAMTRTSNDRLLQRAGRVAKRIRTRIREAAATGTQFGSVRTDEADARWPSDFWHNHRGI